MRLTRRQLRDLGLLVALSTPATGFLSFAMLSIAFGESPFEGPDGVTILGYAAFGVPVVVGGAIVAWAQKGTRQPSRHHIAAALAIFAAASMILGGWSATRSDDASIGGALLVMAGIIIGLASLALLFAARSGESPTPPPPE